MSLLKRAFKKMRSNRNRIKRIEKQLNMVVNILDPTGFYTSGERQVTANLENIRADHRGRYQFVANQLSPNERVLDMACGIGYGACIMASKQPSASIVGVDISHEAVEFANNYYKTENNEFHCGNGLTIDLDAGSFDGAVSFETIEHVKEDSLFVDRFFNLLKPGGWFICSVPNETTNPHSVSQNPFHVRHYTVNDIVTLLKSGGFEVQDIYSQQTKNSQAVTKGDDGVFLIIQCRKPK